MLSHDENQTEQITEEENHLVNTTRNRDTTTERYRNAENLARALRGFHSSQSDEVTTPINSGLSAITVSKARGRSKDKRICQLNAAYKYSLHLEKTIRDMCERQNAPVPNDCQLIALNGLANVNNHLNISHASDRGRTLNDDEEFDEQSTEVSVNAFLTPIQKNNTSIIHESSTLSSAVTSSSITNPGSGSDGGSSCGGGVVTRRRSQRHLQSFQGVDASPILGTTKDHYMNENEVETDLSDLRSRLGKKRTIKQTTNETSFTNTSADSSANSSQSKRRALKDITNTYNGQAGEADSNQATPTASTSTAKIPKLEVPPQTRQYFLRSQTRPKNLESPYTTVTTRQKNRIKKEMMHMNSSLASSSSSSLLTSTTSSVATTASSSNPSLSTSAGNSSSTAHDLDAMDSRTLLKTDSMSEDQIATIFNLNESDLVRTKTHIKFL